MAGLGTLQASSMVTPRLFHRESQRMGSSCGFLEKQNRAGGRDFLERNGWSLIPGCSSGPFGWQSWHQGTHLPTIAEDPKMQVFFLLEAPLSPFIAQPSPVLCTFFCALSRVQGPFRLPFLFRRKGRVSCTTGGPCLTTALFTNCSKL